MSAPSSKVCSDLEWKAEVDAEERIKRRAATSRDSNAAKKSKKAKGDKSSSPNTSDRSGKRKKDGKSRSRSKANSIMRVREERRIKQTKDAKKAEAEEAGKKARKCNPKLEDHVGNIIAAAQGVVDEETAAPEDFFWEVEAVVGRRIRRGRVEFHIRWKGCSEDGNTWEPTANLCDSALEEASKYTKALKLKEEQREADEKKLFGPTEDSTNDNNAAVGVGDLSMDDTEGMAVIDDELKEIVVIDDQPNADDIMEIDPETPVVDDHLWKWSDADQVEFREIERIDVNDPNAGKIVTDARINGTPLVLVGHVGWANFAERWLTEKKIAKGNGESHASKSDSKAKIKGGELNPISVNLTAEAGGGGDSNATQPGISESKVGSEGGEDGVSESRDKSVGGGEKGKKNDSSSDDLLDLSKNYQLDIKKMIKDIGKEDVPVIKRHYNEEKPIHGKIPAEKFLTSCWPTPDSESVPEQEEKTTKSQRNASNLYLHQWQFPLSDTAGRKLCHHNNALPKGIMGEDLLKYWLDLPQCKLDSPLQYIFMGRADTLSKLHRDPGGLAISIAPIVGQKECVLVHRDDGSNCLYHLTASLEDMDLHRHPLLSQARTWRSVIQPGEILLMPYGTYHQCRNVTPCLSYSRFHLDTVNLLPFVQSLINGDAPEIDHEEVLWNLTSELINRLDGVFDEVQKRVQAGQSEGDLISGVVIETVNTLRTLRHFMREVARREEIRQIVKGDSDKTNNQEHNFGMLVDDIDMSLHEFRYRQSKVIPPFKPRRGKVLKNTLSSGSSKKFLKRDMSKFRIGSKPVVAFNTSLENNYTSMVNADLAKHFPNASKDKVGESLVGELVPGDKISVKLEQKFVKAEVVEVLPQMKCAYLSFEDYPSVYDEYQPIELVRLPTGAEIPSEDIKPGLAVIDLSNSNEYRARIQSTVDGPMVRVKLIVSQHEMTRLVSTAMVLGRYVPRQRKSKQTNAEKNASVTEMKELALPPTLPPTKVGDIVEVGKRGAARVIKLHGDPVLTHVDVRFILGLAKSESMVPVEMVQLAPELNPNSGRGRRQVTKRKRGTSPDEDGGKNNISEPKEIETITGGLVSPSRTDSSVD